MDVLCPLCVSNPPAAERLRGYWVPGWNCHFPPKPRFCQGPQHSQPRFLWLPCCLEQESQRTFRTHSGPGQTSCGYAGYPLMFSQPPWAPCLPATHLSAGSLSPFLELAVPTSCPGRCPPSPLPPQPGACPRLFASSTGLALPPGEARAFLPLGRPSILLVRAVRALHKCVSKA